jgi:hypothetical protein
VPQRRKAKAGLDLRVQSRFFYWADDIAWRSPARNGGPLRAIIDEKGKSCSDSEIADSSSTISINVIVARIKIP